MPIINQIVKGAGGSQTKYGSDIDATLGSVDSSGAYKYGVMPAGSTLTFDGIKSITLSYALMARFVGVSGVTTVIFPDLESATGTNALQGMFEYCADLSAMYFPKLKTLGANVFRYMLTGTSGVTMHYRYENYNTPVFNDTYGGTNVTITFDLTDLGSVATLPDPTTYSSSDIGLTCECNGLYYQLADDGAGNLIWSDITH